MKRLSCLILAMIMIIPTLSAAGLTASALNSPFLYINYTEQIVNESTLYLGEIFLGGESTVKYLYSDDMTISPVPSPGAAEKLIDALSGMGYDDILRKFVYGAETEYPTSKGIALSSAFGDKMSEKWRSADAAAAECFKGEVTECSAARYYDLSEQFRNYVDTIDEARCDAADPIPPDGRFFFIVGEVEKSIPHTVVVDGEEKRNYGLEITHQLEAVEVVYTSVSVIATDDSPIEIDSDIGTETEDISDIGADTDILDTNSDVNVDTENISDTDIIDFDTNIDTSDVDSDIIVDTNDISGSDSDSSNILDTDSDSSVHTDNIIDIDTLDIVDTDSNISVDTLDIVDSDSDRNVDTIDISDSDNDSSDSDRGEDTVLGDINGDGVLDSADALDILRFSVGLFQWNGDIIAIADINHDGVIDSADALVLLRFSVGLDIFK